MSKLLKIDDYKITDNIKEFFYDGCHKIYLIEDEADKTLFLTEKNYTNEDIYNIEDLQYIFDNSCPLRFINTCKLKTIVPQCQEEAKFTYDDKIVYSKL